MKIQFEDFGWVEVTTEIAKKFVKGEKINISVKYDDLSKGITECVVSPEETEMKKTSKFFDDMAIHAYKILANQGLINAKVTKPRSLHNVICDIELFTSNELDKDALLTDIAQAKGQLDAIANAVEKGDYEKAYSIINPAAKYYGNNEID